MGAESFHAYGRTDGQADGKTEVTKLIVAFHSFAKAPKKAKLLKSPCYMCASYTRGRKCLAAASRSKSRRGKIRNVRLKLQLAVFRMNKSEGY